MIALPLLLAATSLAGAVETVTLWHQMRPGDRAILAERIAAFEAEHPGEVRVRALYKETEELRSGLESAVLVGRGPDIVYGPSDTVGVYDEIGALQDLGEWFDDGERDAFDPKALVTAPPLDGVAGDSGDSPQDRLLLVGDRFGNHLALVYNRDVVAEPPTTTDELVRVAKAATLDRDGDGRPERYGLVWNYTEPFFVVPFLTGHGSWVFDEARRAKTGEFTPTIDTPEARAAFGFVAALRNEHRVLPESADYETAAALFLAGKAAMIVDGDWSWNRYVSAEGIDAAVAPLPDVSSTGLAMAPMVAPKGYSLSVAAVGERREWAGRLICYLTGEATQRRFLEAKILPSRLAVRGDPRLREDPTMRASIAQVERGRDMPTAV
ncbi:MAG: extracellular solute-binding protein, partial [Planctomycetota bacterium]